ncbi:MULTISPECIES: TrmB family transcriptional regulator [Paenibacillus]|uniref:TrmB family transcriptional regulator n=1 Tax=Paenibacillus validus TaxID=44253 RepID=A0A7X3CUR5_9BACL|nr:TrmB family transcriptional regulator [Paenibacillus validus]MUG72414.1 TrmB family transcriptional regulator [Paenibacillus validus]
MELLKKIGLSDLESRCYLTLHEQSKLSGYEVAKRVSVSRTNVYAALRSLIDKGACRMIEGDPVRYDAVPIQQLVGHLRLEFEQAADSLVHQLRTPPRTAPSFYNWEGGDALEQAARRMTANARASVIVEIGSEDLPRLEDALVYAENKGLRVILMSFGEVNTRLKHVLVHRRFDEPASEQPRKFTMLFDHRYALLGSFGGPMKPSALETDHPAVVETLTNAYHHNVLMLRIEADFGPQLAAKYGDNYKKLEAGS